MEWVHPSALWLLLLLPPLAWWHLRRPRPALAFADIRLLQPEKPSRPKPLFQVPMLLRLMVLSAIIMGLARPRWPDESTRIPAQSTAIVLVLDVSGSMAEEDIQRQGKNVSRLQAAQWAIRQFVLGDGKNLPGRNEDLIGLVTFAAQVEDACPPTLSHHTVMRFVDGAMPKGQVLENTTNIGDALARALKLLQQAKPKAKAVILLSDGEHNVPSHVVPGALKPRQAAQLVRPFGIKVHTVFLAGDMTSVSSRQAATGLRDVAELTGGQAHQAADAETLLRVYADLDAQERTPVESHEYYRYVELYPWCGMIALLGLLAVAVGEEWRWRRLP